jgi:hypothetical protein
MGFSSGQSLSEVDIGSIFTGAEVAAGAGAFVGVAVGSAELQADNTTNSKVRTNAKCVRIVHRFMSG